MQRRGAAHALLKLRLWQHAYSLAKPFCSFLVPLLILLSSDLQLVLCSFQNWLPEVTHLVMASSVTTIESAYNSKWEKHKFGEWVGLSTMMPRQPVQEMMHAEAARLVEASYGDVLLKTIGRCYETNADMYLGNPFESALVAMRSKTHAVKTHWRVASQSLKLMSVQQELERYERCADPATGWQWCVWSSSVGGTR